MGWKWLAKYFQYHPDKIYTIFNQVINGIISRHFNEICKQGLTFYVRYKDSGGYAGIFSSSRWTWLLQSTQHKGETMYSAHISWHMCHVSQSRKNARCCIFKLLFFVRSSLLCSASSTANKLVMTLMTSFVYMIRVLRTRGKLCLGMVKDDGGRLVVNRLW